MELQIIERPGAFISDIYLIDRGQGVIKNYSQKGKNIQVDVLEEYSVTPTKVKPLLQSVPNDLLDEIVKCFVEYGNHKGVKTRDQTLIEGKLQATENHMKFMNKNFDKLINKVCK